MASAPNPFLAGLPQMNIARPDHIYRGPINRTLTGRTEGELDNRAIYVFDTLKFNEQWQLSLGARYERNEGKTSLANVVLAPTAANQPLPAQPIGTVTGFGVPFKSNDDLFSYRAGLVYKPVENGSVYVAYGNSKTPSKASVNGSCTALGLQRCVSGSTEAGTSRVNICAEASSGKATGADCSADSDCASNICVGLKCAATCCVDGDCDFDKPCVADGIEPRPHCAL